MTLLLKKCASEALREFLIASNPDAYANAGDASLARQMALRKRRSSQEYSWHTTRLIWQTTPLWLLALQGLEPI